MALESSERPTHSVEKSAYSGSGFSEADMLLLKEIAIAAGAANTLKSFGLDHFALVDGKTDLTAFEPITPAPSRTITSALSEPIRSVPERPIYSAPFTPITSAEVHPIHSLPVRPTTSAEVHPIHSLPVTPITSAEVHPIHSLPLTPNILDELRR